MRAFVPAPTSGLSYVWGARLDRLVSLFPFLPGERAVIRQCPCGSVVEHSLGKGEVGSSILPMGTTLPGVLPPVSFGTKVPGPLSGVFFFVDEGAVQLILAEDVVA